MIDLTSQDIQLISRSLSRSFFECESVYKRNVNTNQSYASLVAECAAHYQELYHRLTGCDLVTDSSSLRKIIYPDVESV